MNILSVLILIFIIFIYLRFKSIILFKFILFLNYFLLLVFLNFFIFILWLKSLLSKFSWLICYFFKIFRDWILLFFLSFNLNIIFYFNIFRIQISWRNVIIFFLGSHNILIGSIKYLLIVFIELTYIWTLQII